MFFLVCCSFFCGVLLDMLLFHCFPPCKFMKTHVGQPQGTLVIFGCHAGLFLNWYGSPLCSWRHLIGLLVSVGTLLFFEVINSWGLYFFHEHHQYFLFVLCNNMKDKMFCAVVLGILQYFLEWLMWSNPILWQTEAEHHGIPNGSHTYCISWHYQKSLVLL